MKRFLIVFVMIILLPVTAFADNTDSKKEYDEYLSQYDLSVFEEYLDSDTYSILKELGIEDFDYDDISGLSIESVRKIAKKMLQGKIESPISGALAVIVLVLLSAFFQGIKLNDEGLNNVYSVASAIIISIVLVMKIGTTISISATTLKVAADFIYAFVPVFCAIVATGGGLTTTLSTNTTLLMLAQGISFLSSNVVMPVINCFLALGICSGLSKEVQLDNLVRSVKNVITKGISIVCSAFVSVLSLKTTIASRTDILGLRSIRFVINSVVPVIGASISEGLLSIQSYSSLIKSSVGIVGIVAIALTFLPAIIEVMLWRISLSICIIVSDLFGDSPVSKVTGAFKDTLLLLNVVLILSMVTSIISFGILIATRTA